MKIFLLAIILALISSVVCGSLNLVARKTVYDEGEIVAINAAVKLDANEKISTLTCYFNNVPIASAENSIYYRTNAITRFQDRIDSFVHDSTNFVIIIKLVANDYGIYRAIMFTKNVGIVPERYYARNLSIEVKADPVILSFPNVLLGIENSALTFNATVFCRPKPETVLKLEQETVAPWRSINLPENKFNYSYTSFVSSADCGKVFILTVYGVKKQVQQAALIIFAPPKVTVILLKQYTNNSVYVQWKKIVLGKCGLTYVIEFLNSTYDTIQIFDGISNTELSVTISDYARVVKIYAAINGIAGESAIHIMPLANPESNTQKMLEKVPLEVIFGIAVAFIIIPSIIILVVVRKTMQLIVGMMFGM